jgi:hypothetical protein
MDLPSAAPTKISPLRERGERFSFVEPRNIPFIMYLGARRVLIATLRTCFTHSLRLYRWLDGKLRTNQLFLVLAFVPGTSASLLGPEGY